MANVANNKESIKKKRKAPPAGWKPGQSGNPKGRPKDGESWAAIIKEISAMTPTQIVTLVGKDNDLGRSLAQLPKNVMMKKLVVARILAALMFEPTSNLWTSLMERAEGKVPQKIEGEIALGWKAFLENPNPDTETDSK